MYMYVFVYIYDIYEHFRDFKGSAQQTTHGRRDLSGMQLSLLALGHLWSLDLASR